MMLFLRGREETLTLCIALRQSDGSLLSIADSRLTLQSEGKTWRTDLAVKIHFATQESTIYAAERFDVVFSVSGSLSLGLQSILYVDACLKGESGTWADGIINVIDHKLWDFWESAISKDITYAIAFHDHKRRARLFEWQCLGASSHPTYREVNDLNGILLSVHGDGADSIRDQILAEVNSCSYNADPQQVLAFAAIRALQSAIADQSKPYIGGHVQACLVAGHVAEHLVCAGQGGRYLKSAEIDAYEGYKYRTLDLAHPWLDPTTSLKKLIGEATFAPPLIADSR